MSAKKLKPATVRRRLAVVKNAIFRDQIKERTVERKRRQVIANLQERCPHENVTYYPDGVGSHFAFHECDDCGKELPPDWREK